MSRFVSRRLLSAPVSASCKSHQLQSHTLIRPFTSSQMQAAIKSADSEKKNEASTDTMMKTVFGTFADLPGDLSERPTTEAERRLAETYHLHVYATKHNTHMTLTKPDRSPMLSLSSGNLSFRKANRGKFDAAFQLANYFFGKIQERGWHAQIKYTEVIVRGFGVGREAVSKCLMGNEGKMLRPTIIRVTDATRLKFGGTRSRKPRRLG